MVGQKLITIQKELKAPKKQVNTFGKYKYRSCEDILEAVKPLVVKEGCVLVITDTIEQIGERYYVKATATITDSKDGTSISVSAYAREPEEKKGSDVSQVTGASSSYARKYCLNGLFLIDDTKDADVTNTRRTSTATPPKDDAAVELIKQITNKCKEIGGQKNTALMEYVKSNGKYNGMTDVNALKKYYEDVCNIPSI